MMFDRDLVESGVMLVALHKRPTARQRWAAFYRLWRIASRGRSGQEQLMMESCLKVLMHNWKWVQLVTSGGDRLAKRNKAPVFLRRLLAENARELRLLELPEGD